MSLDLGYLLDVPFDWAAPCLDGNPDTCFSGKAAQRAAAIEACRSCPLVVQCATAALQRNEKWGIWGGLDFQYGPSDAAEAAQGRKKRRRAVCGTKAGYDRHNRRREPACPLCRHAIAAYSASYRERRRQTA